MAKSSENLSLFTNATSTDVKALRESFIPKFTSIEDAQAFIATANEYIDALQLLRLPVDEDGVLDEAYGGDEMSQLLDKTSWRKNTGIFVAAVEQSLVPADYVQVFIRSLQMAMIKPLVVSEDRMLVIFSPYISEMAKALSTEEDPDLSSDIGDTIVESILSRQDAAETTEIKPLIVSEMGYRRHTLKLRLADVMGYGYYIGLMISMLRQIRDLVETRTPIASVADYFKQVYRMNFRYFEARVMEYLDAVLSNDLDDVELFDTLMQASVASKIEKLYKIAESIYRNLKSATPGMIERGLYNAIDFAEEQMTTLRRNQPKETLEETLSKTTWFKDRVEKEFNGDHAAAFADMKEGLDVAKMKNATERARESIDDMLETHADQQQVSFETLGQAILKGEINPDEKALLDKVAVCEFIDPLDEKLQSRPWFKDLVAKIAAVSYQGDEGKAQRALLAIYQSSRAKLEARVQTKEAQELLRVAKMVDEGVSPEVAALQAEKTRKKSAKKAD